VNDDLGTEGLVSDVTVAGMVAFGATPRLQRSHTGVMVAYFAVDPEIVEVVLVGKVQRRRVGLVVTLHTLYFHVLDVLVVREDGGGNSRRIAPRWGCVGVCGQRRLGPGAV